MGRVEDRTPVEGRLRDVENCIPRDGRRGEAGAYDTMTADKKIAGVIRLKF